MKTRGNTRVKGRLPALTLSSAALIAGALFMSAPASAVAAADAPREETPGAEARVGESTEDQATMYPELQKYVKQRIEEFEHIPSGRKEALEQLAAYVAERRRKKPDEPVRLTFICTHNSRRSHMSQLWAGAAAAYYGVDRVITYSGGTEATAFNPRAVAAMKRAGFKIARTTDDVNPIYHVRYSDDAHPMTCFSKVYDQAPNPKADFCAVMTCSAADKACPAVRGAARRVAVMYDDPKAFDDTPKEEDGYSDRCAQIARGMLYVFHRAAQQTQNGV